MPARKEIALRYLIVILAAYGLTGCAGNVVMLNPRTGQTTTCRASSLNPWSQQEVCVGDHIAQGWKKRE
ncbi:MAG TPA: hypothetical protein VKC57_09310 [Ktedonobacterales bacterium]|nr:hypothetical protein [Ktedonobacterales bacterium]